MSFASPAPGRLLACWLLMGTLLPGVLALSQGQNSDQYFTSGEVPMSQQWARERGPHSAGDPIPGKVKGFRRGRVVIGRASTRIRQGDRLGIYRNGRLINYCIVREDGFRDSTAWFHPDLIEPRTGDITQSLEWPNAHEESRKCLQEGRSLLVRGERNSALPLLLESYERDNRFWEGAFLLATLLFREGEREPADRWLLKVLEGRQCNGQHLARPTLLKGLIALDEGRVKDALWSFQESLQRHSPDRSDRLEAWAGVAFAALILQEGLWENDRVHWAGEQKRRALRQITTLASLPAGYDGLNELTHRLLDHWLPEDSPILELRIY